MRRALVMAEARALVECSGEPYRLVPEFRCALDAELDPDPEPDPLPADALITDVSDPNQFWELAYVLRTGLTRLEAQRVRRSARRQARCLDGSAGATNAAKTG